MHWLSSTGHIIWANNTELRVLGYTAEEYIGQPVMNFCPDEETLVLHIFKQLGSGNTIKDVPVRFRAKDGRIVPLLIDSNVNYTASGEFNHTRCFIRDDTGRKVREAQTEALLRESLRTRELFDAFVSRTLHLIRTPCHVLLSVLEEIHLLDLAPPPAAGRGALSAGARRAALLAQCSGHVSRIVEMTRDFSDSIKFEQCASLRTAPAAHDLRELCKAALADAAPLCRPGVKMFLDFAEGGAGVRTDGAVLRRVLHHLLRNAAQATAEGQLALRVSHAPSAVHLSVCDTGRGLDPDDPHIFQRYRQPPPVSASDTPWEDRSKLERDLALSSGNEGVGVGLSLSYSLVAALGGELRYTSAPGATTFSFGLPRDVADASPSAPAELSEVPNPHDAEAAKEGGGRQLGERRASGMSDDSRTPLSDGQASASPSPSTAKRRTVPPASAAEFAEWMRRSKQRELDATCDFEPPPQTEMGLDVARVAQVGIFEAARPPHVLVVDDSPLCLKMLVTRLRHMGCTTETAADGAQAVQRLRDAAVSGEAFDLVLMDIRMPTMDGYEATRIAKHELKVVAPIVAVSAEEGVNAELFDGFVPKPLKLETLKWLLQRYTGMGPEAHEQGAASDVVTYASV